MLLLFSLLSRTLPRLLASSNRTTPGLASALRSMARPALFSEPWCAHTWFAHTQVQQPENLQSRLTRPSPERKGPESRQLCRSGSSQAVGAGVPQATLPRLPREGRKCPPLFTARLRARSFPSLFLSCSGCSRELHLAAW